MTKKQAFAEFKAMYPPDAFTHPTVTDRVSRRIDKIKRNEAWGNFVDALCKTGQITMKQYETWTNPF